MIPVHDLSDRRWQALLDADAAGEPLSPAERAFLADHRPEGPAVAAEQRFYRELARAAARDDDADDPAIAGALAAFHADPTPLPQETGPEAPAPKAKRRGGVSILGYLLLAAGLAALWLGGPPAWLASRPGAPQPLAAAPAPPGTPAAPDPPGTPAVAPQPAAPDSPLLAPAPSPALAALSGPLRGDNGDLSPGTAITPSAVVRAGATEACLGAQGLQSMCLAPGSEAQVLADSLLLTAGSARVEASAAHTVAVRVAGVRIAAADAAFTLTVTGDTWTAEVTRGEVELADERGPLARLGPGDILRRGTSTATRPTPTGPAETATPARPAARPGKPARPPSELLDEARSLRAAGEHARAARAYEALISAHPDAPSATAALVALGQLYLGKLGDPPAALRSFDRYLQRAPSGPLAEEAAHGRIDALRRLGRAADERAAIAEFLDRYPASSYADGLRKRLAP
jgi:tetratricopeptide (TPR) repeat protein